MPFESTRTVPSFVMATFKLVVAVAAVAAGAAVVAGDAVVAGAAVAGGAVVVAVDELDDLLLLPHAARANAATPANASARRWERRMGPPGYGMPAGAGEDNARYGPRPDPVR